MTPAVGENFCDTVPDETDFIIRRQCVCYSSQLAGCPPIVAVQKRDDLAGALRNPDIECRRLSAILFANQPDPRRKFPNDLRRPVGRTVVDGDDLYGDRPAGGGDLPDGRLSPPPASTIASCSTA